MTRQSGVTLEAYLSRPHIQGLMKAHRIELLAKHYQANTISGEVVEFEIESAGLREKALDLKWQLFNAGTGEIITTSAESDPFGPLQSTAHKKDLDVGTWESWIDTTKARGKRSI